MVKVSVGYDHRIWREPQRLSRSEISWKEILAVRAIEGRDQARVPQVVQSATSSRLEEFAEQSTERAEVQAKVKEKPTVSALHAKLRATNRLVTIKQDKLHLRRPFQGHVDSGGPARGPSRPHSLIQVALSQSSCEHMA